MANGQSENLVLTKEADAKGFVAWFAERHREITGRPVDPEPIEKCVRIAKLMLDEIDFADAGGRALLFLKSRRYEKESAKFSFFCIYALRNLDGLNEEAERTRRLERIIETNFILSQAKREDGFVWYPPDEGNSVNQINKLHKERAKEYSLGELEYLAAQLLEQYGTPDAIPKGVKQRLDKGRQ